MKWLLLLGLIYLAGGLSLYFFQERLIFRPDLAPKEVQLPPKAHKLFLDGLEVGVIDKKSDTTLFYFGGNADNAVEALTLFGDLPFNVVTVNYPGYGNSQGSPSQKSIFQGAAKVFEHFRTAHTIIIGRSLGTGVAAYIAANYPVDGIVLITPYHSITHLARLRYPIYPVRLLVRHPFPIYQYIQQSDAPTIVFLAEYDDTTPRITFEKLRPYIKNLKKVILIPNATHADILEKAKKKIKKEIGELARGQRLRGH